MRRMDIEETIDAEEEMTLLLDSLAGLPGADKARIVESLSADTKTYENSMDTASKYINKFKDY